MFIKKPLNTNLILSQATFEGQDLSTLQLSVCRTKFHTPYALSKIEGAKCFVDVTFNWGNLYNHKDLRVATYSIIYC